MRDERSRYFRRLRRLRYSARGWTVLASGLIGAAAVLVPYQGLAAADAVWAGLAGASVAFAWWRWSEARQLAAQPVPDPPDPALAGDRWLALLTYLPGGVPLAEALGRQRIRGALRGSRAADAAERLDRSARTMREFTGRLAGIDQDAAQEATAVHQQLGTLTNQVASLEQALRSAPEQARPPLRELRDAYVSHLEQGVTAYEQFVVAAAGYLSESGRAGSTGPDLASLEHAAQRLRSVTAGLAELRHHYGDPADGRLGTSG